MNHDARLIHGPVSSREAFAELDRREIPVDRPHYHHVPSCYNAHGEATHAIDLSDEEQAALEQDCDRREELRRLPHIDNVRDDGLDL